MNCFSVYYGISNIVSFYGNSSTLISTKGDLAMKYAREVNKNGSWFIDVISCPTNITLSWSSVRTTGITTQLRLESSTILCKGTSVHAWNDLDIYFNADYDDLLFAEYNGSQVAINSSILTGTFGDSDVTNINLGTSWFLSPDGIDDNFDSDNYSASSTWSTYYPNGYSDDDDAWRLASYGYVIEDSWLFNVFWSNLPMQNYIAGNSYNTNPAREKLWDINSGYLYLDIDTSHRMVLYEIDRESYSVASELKIINTYTGTWELAGLWYLQSDMTLDSWTWSAFDFDFTTTDYALFVENTSSWALLYKVSGEDAVSWNEIYISPLKDDDNALFSFYGSHMLVDEQWRLIGEQLEVFWLK